MAASGLLQDADNTLIIINIDIVYEYKKRGDKCRP